jgi:hypothetical protein
MPTKVTRASHVGATVAPNCPVFYVLNVSDPAHPICEPGPVLKVPGVGWVWSNRDIVAPSLAAGLVVGGGLSLLKAPLIASLGVGAVVLLAVGFFLSASRAGQV